jgi:hypothetical protein
MMGGRPCDKRNEYKIIRAKFPEYKFEEDFDTADMDPLWKANSIEDKSEFMDRMKRVQEKIFMETKDKATYIHLTMHDGSIRTALKVFQPLLGQREKLIDDIGKKLQGPGSKSIKKLWETRQILLESELGGGVPLTYLPSGGMVIVVAKVTYDETQNQQNP